MTADSDDEQRPYPYHRANYLVMHDILQALCNSPDASAYVPQGPREAAQIPIMIHMGFVYAYGDGSVWAPTQRGVELLFALREGKGWRQICAEWGWPVD